MASKTILITLALAGAVLLCGPREALAQQVSVGVTPASVDAKIRPGAAHTQTYTIFNHTGARLRFRCAVTDYWYDEQNRRLMGRPGTLPRSASLWVQLTPSEVVVEPDASATVKAVITVPPDAVGSYYTMPVFEAVPEVAKPVGAASAATIGVRFRGLMMLTTEAGADYQIEIAGGRATPPTASSPLGLDLDVRNHGTAHARVRGSFALIDAAGRPAGRGKLNEKRLLPGQRDSCRGDWAGELTPGRYVAVVTLSYDRAGAEPATLVYELPFEVKKRPGTELLADK